MAAQQTSATVGSLMARFRAGDHGAADELFVLLHPELRRIAAAKMNGEVSGHSWQPSLLVNELYLHLVNVKSLPTAVKLRTFGTRAFPAIRRSVMRHLLIDHSRLLARRTTKVDFSQFDRIVEETGIATLQEIDDLLDKLGSINARLRSIVEMKVFEGLSLEEIAERLI